MKSKSDIIIFDCETTGLLAPMATKIESQPYLTEAYCVRLTKDFEFVEEFESMVKPPVPISEEITRITGITDETVKDAPNFIQIYDELYDIFECCRNVSAHNAMFDLGVLNRELFRYDKEMEFNWPKNKFCSVEASRHYFNKRLTLQKLHEHLFGVGFEGAHRARHDVEATAKCFMKMVELGDIKL